LIVIQEIDRHLHRDAADAAAIIRAAVTENHEIAPYAVVLVRQNGVPKTSSGKIQRRACARAFLDAGLPVVYEWKERTVVEDEDADIEARSQEDIEAFLAQKLASSLLISPNDVDFTQPFSTLGLDSLRTMTLLGEIEVWLGRKLSPTLFWNYPSISDLAAHLSEMLADGSAHDDGRN
jgi:acyl carrier protein